MVPAQQVQHGMYAQIAALPLRAVPVLLRLAENALHIYNDIAKHYKPGIGVHRILILRIHPSFRALFKFHKGKGQHIGYRVHTAVFPGKVEKVRSHYRKV